MDVPGFIQKTADRCERGRMPGNIMHTLRTAAVERRSAVLSSIAAELYHRGLYQKCLDFICAHFEAMDKRDIRTHNTIASCHLYLGNFSAVPVAIDNASNFGAVQNAYCHSLKANAYRQMGEMQSSIDAAMEGIELPNNDDNQHVFLAVELIRTYRLVRQYDDAERIASTCKHRLTDDVKPETLGRYWHNIIGMYYEQADYAAVIDVYGSASEALLRPEPHIFAATAYALTGRMDEAERAVDRYHALHGTFTHNLVDVLLLIHDARGEEQNIIDVISEANRQGVTPEIRQSQHIWDQYYDQAAPREADVSNDPW